MISGVVVGHCIHVTDCVVVSLGHIIIALLTREESPPAIEVVMGPSAKHITHGATIECYPVACNRPTAAQLQEAVFDLRTA
jgi:hypothetical protein